MLPAFITLAMAILFGFIAYFETIPFLYGVSVFFSCISMFFSFLELRVLLEEQRKFVDCRMDGGDQE